MCGWNSRFFLELILTSILVLLHAKHMLITIVILLGQVYRKNVPLCVKKEKLFLKESLFIQ